MKNQKNFEDRYNEDVKSFSSGSSSSEISSSSESEKDFDACLKETIETIHKAKHNEHIPFCVFKVTGLARFDLLIKYH